MRGPNRASPVSPCRSDPGRDCSPTVTGQEELAPLLAADAYAGGVLKFLLVLFVLAAVVYLTTRAVEGRLGNSPKAQPPARPVAPDDDPEFLRDLDFERRRQQRNNGSQAPGDDTVPGEDETPA